MTMSYVAPFHHVWSRTFLSAPASRMARQPSGQDCSVAFTSCTSAATPAAAGAAKLVPELVAFAAVTPRSVGRGSPDLRFDRLDEACHSFAATLDRQSRELQLVDAYLGGMLNAHAVGQFGEFGHHERDDHLLL
jgi:hypothetical protein